jgi:2-C-methyl-D-erythritol 4-phosphate cytidylyltransferase
MINAKEVIAIVLFGGVGKRFGWDRPKQFFFVKSKTILEYSVEAFEKNKYVDRIIIVSSKEFINETRELVKNFRKVSKIVEGGNTRTESSINGLLAIENKDSFVLIHDGARPLVSQELISRVVEAIPEKGAVIPCLKVFDTLVEVSDGKVTSFLDRDKILRVQTPQGFKYEIILEAYEKLTKSGNMSFPDDSSVVRYIGISEIYVVEGEVRNIKITTRDDVELMEYYIEKFEIV